MEQTANMDVGKCEFKECVKFAECYRSIAQSSNYDFKNICKEENEYKWFMQNKNVESEKTNE